jgi:hypothetical protein
MTAVYDHIEWGENQDEYSHFAAELSDHLASILDWVLVQVLILKPIRCCQNECCT